MLKSQILNAVSAADVFGDITDKEELNRSAARLKELFKDHDPDREEAYKKIGQFLKEREYPAAKVEKGVVRTRKSPYKVGKLKSRRDSIVVHDTINKRNIPLTFTFSTKEKMNPLIAHANDTVEKIRRSVTKRNRNNFPEIVDTFYMSHSSGAELLATIHNAGDGPSLNNLQGEHIPDQQIAHLYREMLETLRKTHEAGIIHGACYLDSWTFDMTSNRLILDNWYYSVSQGDTSQLLPSNLVEQGLIPARQVSNRTMKTETDIRLASLSMFALTDENNSPWLRKYLHSQAEYTHNDAKQIMKEFTDLFRNKQGCEPEPMGEEFIESISE